VRPADGSGAEEVLVERAEVMQTSDWSRDGRHISFNVQSPNTRSDIWVLPLFGERKPFPLVATTFVDADGMFSPDGRWVVYDSSSSGISETYAIPFPGPGGKFQISSGGGDWPRWAPDGKQVMFENGGDFYIANVTYDSQSFQVTKTSKLFSANVVGTSNSYYYDIAPDNRVLVVASQAKPGSQRLAWISDWRKQLPK
jgi:Tol biopolymer transport system component